MKILQEEEPPHVQTKQWVGKIIRCGNCYSTFQLEEGDPVGLRGMKVSLAIFVSIACPVCRVCVEKRLPSH